MGSRGAALALVLAMLTVVVFVPAPARAGLQWQGKADMPTARGYFGVAALNGKVYAAGGLIEGSPDVATDVVEVYDPGSNNWTTVAAMPGPLWGLVLVGVQGKLVAAGGSADTTAPRIPVNTTYVYDPATDRWSNGSSMPGERIWASGVAAGGGVEVWGGTGPGDFIPPTATNTRFSYNVGADRWTILQPMPLNLTNFGIAGVSTTAYVTGGWRNIANVSSVPLPAGPWQEVSPMLEGRGGHASTDLDGIVYAIAGVTANTTEYVPSRTVEAYSPANDTWWRVPDYPEPAHSLGAVRVGSTLYAMGGTIGTASLRTMYALASGTSPPPPPSSQPPWALIGIAVAVAVILLIAVAAMLWRSRRRPPPPEVPPKPA